MTRASAKRATRLIVLGIVLAVVLSPLLFIGYVAYRRRTCVDFRQRGNPCSGCLRNIGLAVMMYASDNSGVCPPDLQTLHPRYLHSHPDEFYCPYARRDGKIGRYAYFACCVRLPTGAAARASVPVAADYPDNHTGGGHVVWADGHEEWVSKDYQGFVEKHLGRDQVLLDNALDWHEW